MPSSPSSEVKNLASGTGEGAIQLGGRAVKSSWLRHKVLLSLVWFVLTRQICLLFVPQRDIKLLCKKES